MEPNILGSLGLKLGVLSFIQHLNLHLPGQYALVLLKGSILLASLLSKVGSKAEGLDPGLILAFATWQIWLSYLPTSILSGFRSQRSTEKI